jgi:acetolactate synthase-1/2/3 large subunit
LAAEAKGNIDPNRYSAWVSRLRVLDAGKQAEQDRAMSTDNLPIHPLRLCKEVRDFIRRDAILVVDGQEILNFARQSIPTFLPGHRLNSGTFGCMGVGLPYGIGAKVARPDKQVLVLHGDGSFGINAMNRHRVLPESSHLRDLEQWRLDCGYTWESAAEARATPGPHPL